MWSVSRRHRFWRQCLLNDTVQRGVGLCRCDMQFGKGVLCISSVCEICKVKSSECLFFLSLPVVFITSSIRVLLSSNVPLACFPHFFFFSFFPSLLVLRFIFIFFHFRVGVRFYRGVRLRLARGGLGTTAGLCLFALWGVVCFIYFLFSCLLYLSSLWILPGEREYLEIRTARSFAESGVSLEMKKTD